VSFDGQPSVTIAPGKDRSSDAVDLAVPALADLAVTLFLPGRSEATTSHFLAQQTSYVSAPGARGDAPFAAAKTIESWPFLINVDVAAAGDTSAVVVFGDSTVDGDGTTADANRRWPDYLARRFAAAPVGGVRYSVLNLGLIGNRLLRASPGAGSKFGDALGAAGVDRFASDVLAQPGVGCVVLRIGVNDIGFPGAFAPGDAPVTADELIAGFRTVAAAAHANQLRVVATTLAPFGGTAIVDGYYTADKERVRQQVNTWMRSAPELDGVIDADAALRDPARPTRMAASLDSGDHLHPGDAGNEAVAQVAPLAACGTASR
jgi:lysophospholipase L1-like esterase